MKKQIKDNPFVYITLSVIITVLTLAAAFMPDEGMYPLSEIRKLDLKKAGMKIGIDEVYNPEGVSLVDALVNVGGCTASFVSPEGLIITNHHCAFGAIQRASTTEHNYLEDGFLAGDRIKEIPAEGVTCRITDSYKDVSGIILSAAAKADSPSERFELIKKKIDELVKEEEGRDSTIRAEVAEMFTGESYILFRYKMINDVRLVYVPPRAIGEFGGESDNWVWPRHTGDFSFMRAYVAPDGKPAAYSKDNVPYHPKKYIKVNPNGAEEGDFVFILGYPGRTFKHQPSEFLAYQQKYQLPYISELFDWLINLYTVRGKNDPEYALKTASRIKGLANTAKNYRGKILGLKRLNLVEKKQDEEKRLQKYIDSHKELREKYSSLLHDISQVYDGIYQDGRLPLVISMMRRMTTVSRLADIYLNYLYESQKPEVERSKMFKENNRQALMKQVDNIYKDLDLKTDPEIFVKMLSEAALFDELKVKVPFSGFKDKNQVETFASLIYSSSIVLNKNKFTGLFTEVPDTALAYTDPLIKFMQEIRETEDAYKKRDEERQGKLNILLAKLMDVKREWMNKSFVPDANRTLRLTYGYVQGYSPSDAVYYSPITSLRGVIEKGKNSGDYKLPEIIRELYKKKDFGKYKSRKLNDVPVAILYNTDTSGGNSGSPILNAFGELIGVNFDRPFEATVNDYAWSEEYSRSIGVDIRYVLWITSKVGGADFLLKEMGV